MLINLIMYKIIYLNSLLSTHFQAKIVRVAWDLLSFIKFSLFCTIISTSIINVNIFFFAFSYRYI